MDLHRSRRWRIHTAGPALVDSLLVRLLLVPKYASPAQISDTSIKCSANAIPIVDIILSLAWFAAFGILVDAIHKLNCGSIWHWNGFLSGDTCGRWKAAEAFAFISAFVWLVSGIVVRILEINTG